VFIVLAIDLLRLQWSHTQSKVIVVVAGPNPARSMDASSPNYVLSFVNRGSWYWLIIHAGIVLHVWNRAVQTICTTGPQSRV
jgi:hypothetical protein